jgi:hypothetical protein
VDSPSTVGGGIGKSVFEKKHRSRKFARRIQYKNIEEK